MSEEKFETETSFWSLKAYRDQQNQNNDGLRRDRSRFINAVIALAIILSFIGLIVFPQIFLPGMLLSGCLITAQALAGFAVLVVISKALSKIYHEGAKNFFRMLIFGPIDFFINSFKNRPVITTLLVLSFLAIAVVLILSGTGVITVPVLTVFAANSLSLEITEIMLGLLSDLIVIGTVAIFCYLPTFMREVLNECKAKPIDLSSVEDSSDDQQQVDHLCQPKELPQGSINNTSEKNDDANLTRYEDSNIPKVPQAKKK